ncbi:MAG: phytanoyl-CoA dioxygenase family protein [Pseudomonadales bacterium]
MDKWEKAQQCGADQSLTDGQVSQWQNQGFALVQGLIPAPLIHALTEAAQSRYPEPGTIEAAKIADFGSAGDLTFPSQVSSLNKVTLHEPLLSAIGQLLGENVEDLRLTQSDLWPKYGRDVKLGIQDNSDQRIHIDYPNHTIAHPTPWNRPEAVEMIIYLSDVEETGGPTAVVPRQGPDDPAYRWPIVDSPGIGDLRYINDRASAETYFAEQRPELAQWRAQLYERERHTFFKPGDVLFYRHDTWHRGTPMKAGALRLVQNLTYRKAASEWISTLHIGWAWKAYRDNKFLERLIATSSLRQRAVLGFPQPGSNYWCQETIAAIDARYGMFGMDMTPYELAMKPV